MRLRYPMRVLAAALVGTLVPALALAGPAAAVPAPTSATGPTSPGAGSPPASPSKTVTLPNGAKVTYDSTGNGTLTSPDGRSSRPFPVSKVAGHSAFGDVGQPDAAGIGRRVTGETRQPYVSDEVVVGLTGASVTGGPAAAPPGTARHKAHGPAARAAVTSDAGINAALKKVHADVLWPAVDPAATGSTPAAAALDAFIVHVPGTDPATAAQTLSRTPGVAFAHPNAYVSTMSTGPTPVPTWSGGRVAAAGDPAHHPGGPSASGLPANAGLTSSLQSYLNASGVNALGAFADTAKLLHQLPGAGQIVTNVSLGDLTDAGMADNGDSYVQTYGPTTVIKDGQRYLDFPSLPLIPAYTADEAGKLDPTGSVEGADPYLAEVLLDFSMMAPLPHDQQRPEAPGNGLTDLLGIAPGAKYRLVVPEQPTEANLASAFLAAANQTPHPSVITASLGWGTDQVGFPSRYLEDDPLVAAAIRQVVRQGVVVVISSNDGTRLGLPVAVGPDGGSTATDLLAKGEQPTSISEDSLSTTPTKVADSGAIAVGGTTLDDTLTSADPAVASYPTTRYNGSTGFSSGFGGRVNIAAPSDNLPSLMHVCPGPCPSAQAAIVELAGGTSASAPMVAAAAANVLQAAKATGQSLSPTQVRDLLVRTGRPLAPTPQADQPLSMGTRLDVTAAVESVLSRRFQLPPAAVRLSVAQRQELGSLGAAFVEVTDPAAIDLTGPPDPSTGAPSGQNLVSPITFGLDLTGTHDTVDRSLRYRLRIGAHGVIPAGGPSLRVTPAQLFAAAGQPLVAEGTRGFDATFEAYRGATVVASATQHLTFSGTDGGYAEALAPQLPGSASLGKPVTVHYDLTGVRDLADPQLVVSSVGHWTPNGGGDLFRAGYTTPLPALKGSVTIPASAFAAGGAGLYGVGIVQRTDWGQPLYGQFRVIRIGADASHRPPAPVLITEDGTAVHQIEATHAAPRVRLRWDVRTVPGADAAALEVSAPAPTLFGALNTFTNANGSQRDDNGVDHPSTLYRALPARSGTSTLDLGKLGLPDGLQYSVRVLPTADGKPIGQASPSSYLQYDDGDLLPTGFVQNFDVTNGNALLATATFGGDGSLTDSSVTRYTPATGALGGPLVDHTDGRAMDNLIGTDPQLRRTLVVAVPFDNLDGPKLREYNSDTGALVAEVAIPNPGGQLYFDSSRIDPRRHRAAVVTFDGVNGYSQIWSFDLGAGKLSDPLKLNDSAIMYRAFHGLDIDSSTGEVFAATTGTMGPCLAGRAGYAMVRVNLDERTVSPSVTLPLCTSGLATDGKGTVHVLAGAAQPNPYGGDFPTGQWLSADERTLQTGPPAETDSRGPVWPALDIAHGVAVVGHLYEHNFGLDNNAMSEVDTLDPVTGKILTRSAMFNFVNSTIATQNFEFTANRGLQLDPATRTGWVVNPAAAGLQRFTY